MIDRVCAVCALVLLLAPVPVSRAQNDTGWVATWATAQQLPLLGPAAVVNNQTVRQVVRISRGGAAVRVRFSNVLGTSPLTINAASVGVRADGANVVAGSNKPLTFAGKPSITIPAGAIAVSDSVALRVRDQADLAVSTYFAGQFTATTQHTNAIQTSYVSDAGDFSASDTFTPASTFTSWYSLAGIDVRRPRAHTIVAFGDSITEGYASTTDANARWPDALARRLLGTGDDHAVIDMGIGGNRVLNEEIGPNALSRLDRDLLTVDGADYAVLLEGINDIGIPKAGGDFLPPTVSTAEVSADDIIAGYEQIARRAHSAGIAIYIGTLLPIGGSTYFGDDTEAKRQAVNAWIRERHDFDGVIDFDDAVRDPDDAQKISADFDSGDHIHPNDAGYAAMADAIDLRLFRGASRYELQPRYCQ